MASLNGFSARCSIATGQGDLQVCDCASVVAVQLHNDAQWLGSHNIMDYSLLIGAYQLSLVVASCR
jgi:hypothetical protein